MEEIRAAFARYAVLIFPRQDLEAEQHASASPASSGLSASAPVEQATKRQMFRVDPKLADVANLDP